MFNWEEKGARCRPSACRFLSLTRSTCRLPLKVLLQQERQQGFGLGVGLRVFVYWVRLECIRGCY